MANINPRSSRGASLAPLSTPKVVATPNRRGISAEPASGRPPASARRNNVTTPHARAAIRAMDQRRAALFTPGRARRRSLREQRETPRDLLRNLSRALAPTSRVISSSSSPDSSTRDNEATLPSFPEEDEDDDDDFPIERPRFSLPLGPEEDDDDDDLKPPRLSGLEEDNYTMQSIELPRRAVMDNTIRSSLGSMRYSDYMGPEVHSDDVGIDSGFFPPPAFEDSGEVEMEEPAIIERLEADEARRQTLGGDSVFGAIDIPDVGNETTFVMAPVESPVRDPTATEGLEDLDADNGPLDNMNYDDDDDDDHVNEPMDMPDFDVEDEVDEAPENNISTVEETTTSSHTAGLVRDRGLKRKKGKKISRYGIEYPSLPTNVVKRLAMTCAKTAGTKGKISPDTLDAIMQATEWFFEQLGDDLSAYAKHAGRKTIDESDMITLMRRQRQTNASTTPFALAQRHLPRELLQELRMPVPIPSKGPRKKARRIDVEDEEQEEVT
ncbi:centromere kinetochore component CENP-T-domain-containing protein [Xylaria bambusicola]|uniref:centromere kinetochore component CENP-T-domain-containing protein n=1 Tax=Xylaria bambusicola TaxID=326684 RepID=UPI002008418D|nr:centromere kinetochore component CENP-T-domain-containing protein [Xylaria bambusicola]KAI0509245.1 centromere kinetochore component CENP-T-domain-containing protein [Xylaria bambusicola]